VSRLSTRIPVADALVDLLQAIVSTPLEKQPSASDIAKVIKLVSFPLSFILIFIYDVFAAAPSQESRSEGH
jgi:hypothetical protein